MTVRPPEQESGPAPGTDRRTGGPDGGGNAPGPLRGQTVVLVSTIVALVGLFVVLLVARSGPTDSFTSLNRKPPQEPKPKPGVQSVGSEAPTSAPTPAKAHKGSDIIGTILHILLIALAVAAAAFIVAYLIRTFTHLELRRRQRLASPEDFEEAPEDTVEALREAVATNLSTVIERGDPHDAIVACWMRLEDVVAAAGIERAPSETSAELTARVLKTYDVDPRILARLGVLYREARYSGHLMTEEARDAARAALQEVGNELSRSMR